MLIKNRILKFIAAMSLMALLLIGGTRVYAADMPPVLAKAIPGTNKITVTWEKVPGASRYIVYFHNCDGKPLKEKVKTLGSQRTSFTKTGLKPSVDYKFMIAAEKKVKGKYTVIAKSRSLHIASINSKKYTNPKSVTASPGSILACEGDKVSVKAKIKKVDSKKKLLGASHGKEIKWYSSNSAVATVNGNGKVTAVKTGKCKIYAVAINGVTAKIPVTVRAAKKQKKEVPEERKYTVTYKYIGKAPAGAPEVPAEKSYAAGAAVTKQTAPTLKGYTFSGWKGEVTSMPEKDIVVSGFWTEKEYKLIFKYTNPNTKKEISTVVRYNYGDKVSAIADPAVRGYKFDSWTDLPETMPDKDVTVTGSFKKMCKVIAAVYEDSYNMNNIVDEEIYNNEFALFEKVEFEVEEGTMSYQDVLKKLKKTYARLQFTERWLHYWYVENTDLLNDQPVNANDVQSPYITNVNNALDILFGYSSDTYESAGVPEPPERLAELVGYSSEQKEEMGNDKYYEELDTYTTQYIDELLNFSLEAVTENSDIINDDIVLIGWFQSTPD